MRRREELRRALEGIIAPAARFVWEIGSGHGHFLTAYATAHPDESCIGIDIASERIARAERKCERAQLKNLHFVRADAEDFLASMPKRARFTAIFILFPDPWPKRRHHKNRLIKPGFLSAAAAKSGRGAGLYFRTDHEPYFKEAAATIREHPDWVVHDTEILPLEEPTVFQKRASRYFTLVATRR
jgi:tRNA (guanine-N7-)-methyltransferase